MRKGLENVATPILAHNLGMAKSAQQEGFGDSFILALAGTSGCAVSQRRPDDDSVDWTLSCRLPTRPKIDVQVKTWTGDDGNGPNLRYPLPIKNYNDLIATPVMAPRMLVVVTVPHTAVDWTDCTPASTILKHAAYWVSLLGLPSITGQDKVTVYLPRANLLTADAVQDMMVRADAGLPL